MGDQVIVTRDGRRNDLRDHRRARPGLTLLPFQHIALMVQAVQLIAQNRRVNPRLDAFHHPANLPLYFLQTPISPLHVDAHLLKLAARLLSKAALEALQRSRSQEAMLQRFQHCALHHIPIHLQVVRARRRTPIFVPRAPVPVAVDNHVVRAALGARQQAAQEILRARASPCPLAGCRLLEHALVRDRLLARLDLLPQLLRHDAQIGRIHLHPQGWIVGLANALAGIRIGDEAASVPDVTPIVKRIIQNSASIFRVAVDRRARPRPSTR